MITLILIFNLWAQPIAIQSQQSSDLEYEKYLNDHPELISYVQYFKKQHLNLSHALYQELKQAQFEFINGSLEKSHQHFQRIVDLKHQQDWNEEERATIHFAFLRLAQLTSEDLVKNQLLIDAFEFDPTLKIDKLLFPPPMVETYYSLKKTKKENVWSLPQNADQFDEVLLNGRSVGKRTGFVRAPNSIQRFTFLSNRFKAVTLTVKSSQLETIKIVLSPLSEGNCENPRWTQEMDEKIDFILIDQDCIGRSNYNLNTHPPKIVGLSQIEHKSRSQFSFVKSKWFWLGVSVLAVGAIVSQNQKQESVAHPPVVKIYTNE